MFPWRSITPGEPMFDTERSRSFQYLGAYGSVAARGGKIMRPMRKLFLLKAVKCYRQDVEKIRRRPGVGC